MHTFRRNGFGAGCAQIRTLLHDMDALVLPSMPDGAPDRSTIGPHFCQVPWTMMGWPAITLPSGLSSEGLPLGASACRRAIRRTRSVGGGALGGAPA